MAQCLESSSNAGGLPLETIRDRIKLAEIAIFHPDHLHTMFARRTIFFYACPVCQLTVLPFSKEVICINCGLRTHRSCYSKITGICPVDPLVVDNSVYFSNSLFRFHDKSSSSFSQHRDIGKKKSRSLLPAVIGSVVGVALAGPLGAIVAAAFLQGGSDYLGSNDNNDTEDDDDDDLRNFKTMNEYCNHVINRDMHSLAVSGSLYFRPLINKDDEDAVHLWLFRANLLLNICQGCKATFGSSLHMTKDQTSNRSRLSSTRVSVYAIPLSSITDHLEVITIMVKSLNQYDNGLLLSVDTLEMVDDDNDLMLNVFLSPSSSSTSLCDVKYRLDLSTRNDVMAISLCDSTQFSCLLRIVFQLLLKDLTCKYLTNDDDDDDGGGNHDIACIHLARQVSSCSRVLDAYLISSMSPHHWSSILSDDGDKILTSHIQTVTSQIDRMLLSDSYSVIQHSFELAWTEEDDALMMAVRLLKSSNSLSFCITSMDHMIACYVSPSAWTKLTHLVLAFREIAEGLPEKDLMSADVLLDHIQMLLYQLHHHYGDQYMRWFSQLKYIEAMIRDDGWMLGQEGYSAVALHATITHLIQDHSDDSNNDNDDDRLFT